MKTILRLQPLPHSLSLLHTNHHTPIYSPAFQFLALPLNPNPSLLPLHLKYTNQTHPHSQASIYPSVPFSHTRYRICLNSPPPSPVLPIRNRRNLNPRCSPPQVSPPLYSRSSLLRCQLCAGRAKCKGPANYCHIFSSIFGYVGFF